MNFAWKHPHPRLWTCECSPRGDYRLRIEMVTDPPDREISYVVEAEWLSGGSDFITRVTSMDAARHEAELWAKEYETQDARECG